LFGNPTLSQGFQGALTLSLHVIACRQLQAPNSNDSVGKSKPTKAKRKKKKNEID
jgi:hypothetical protein